jgi:hypothetical protein
VRKYRTEEDRAKHGRTVSDLAVPSRAVFAEQYRTAQDYIDM